MGWSAIVQLALPEEVRQAIQVRDGMPMKDHTEEVARGLTPPTGDFLPTGPALAAFYHVMNGRGRSIGAGLKAHRPGTAYGDSLAHQSDGASGLFRGNQVQRAELVICAPAAPVAQRGKVLEYFFF